MGNRKILILGIGNLVLQDEGFGVHVVQALAKEGGFDEDVTLLDGGTGGLHLMGELQNYGRVIVVDASLDRYPTGTVRVLKPAYGEFPPLVTAHEIGLKDTLEALELTGKAMPDVTLVVCSVEHYTSLGTEMTPAVAAAMDEAKARVRELVGRQS